MARMSYFTSLQQLYQTGQSVTKMSKLKQKTLQRTLFNINLLFSTQEILFCSLLF